MHVLSGMYDAVCDIFRIYIVLRAHDILQVLLVPYDALVNDQVSSRLYLAGLHYAAYFDIPHGADRETAAHIAPHQHVSYKINISRRVIHIPVDFKERPYREIPPAEFHPSVQRCQKLVPVLADLRILPFRDRHAPPVLAAQLLIQHVPPRNPFRRRDRLADQIALFNILLGTKGRIVHIAEFIHLRHTLHIPEKIIYDIAVIPVRRLASPCNRKQMEIPVIVLRQFLQKLQIHPVSDFLFLQRITEDLPVQFFSHACRREDHDPRIHLV